MPVFPSQNLDSQKICESYPKLLQIYNNNLVLDGTGSLKQLLNVTSSYALNCLCPAGESITGSFCSSSIWTFNHNLGSKYVIIQTYDENNNQIIPDVVNLYDNDTAIISFGQNICGVAIASLGGRTQVTRSFYLGTGSYYPITASWALNTITSSYIQVSNVSYPIKTVNNNYNITNTDYTILCNATSIGFNVKLPSAASVNSQIFNIKKIDGTGNIINVYTSAGNYIDYDVTQSIAHRGTNMTVQSDGSQYWIL